MRLSDQQWEFTKDIAKLILYAEKLGYKLTMGEAKRTKYQQQEYVRLGLSKTMNSDHLISMAQDFNIFFDYDGDGDKDYIGSLVNAKQVAERLGDYWKSLSIHNYWGGDWGWDVPHFGRRRI